MCFRIKSILTGSEIDPKFPGYKVFNYKRYEVLGGTAQTIIESLHGSEWRFEWFYKWAIISIRAPIMSPARYMLSASAIRSAAALCIPTGLRFPGSPIILPMIKK